MFSLDRVAEWPSKLDARAECGRGLILGIDILRDVGHGGGWRLVLVVALAAQFLAPVPPAGAADPQTFWITSSADSGSGSLRTAIEDANAHPGRDLLMFSGGVNGPMDIVLASPLPPITEGVGIAESGGPTNPKVRLRGGAVTGPGLVISGDNTYLSGIGVFEFNGDGIVVHGDDVVLDDVSVGTDYVGVAGLGNRGAGIVIAADADRTVLGSNGPGNRIGANGSWGVVVRGTGAVVGRNVVGDPIHPAGSGPSTLGNGAGGVWVDGATSAFVGRGTDGPRVLANRGPGVAVNNGADSTTLQSVDIADNAGDGVRITGAATGTGLRYTYGTRSMISGNLGNGVVVRGAGVTDTLVGPADIGGHNRGNRDNGVLVDGAARTRIGSDPAARYSSSTVSSNGRDGIVVDNATDTTVVHLASTANGGAGVRVRGSTRTTIGGEHDSYLTTSFSGNDGSGVSVEPGSTTTTIDGSYIGAGSSPYIGAGNGGDGITITGAAGTTVTDNVVVGSGGYGIRVTAVPASPRTTVTANDIGTYKRGGSPRPVRPNARGGILVDQSSLDIGDRLQPAIANEIARNGGAGIALRSPGRTVIAGNAIDHNAGLAIDHLTDAVPAPVLTATQSNATQTTVTGTLIGAPTAVYAIDVYRGPACDQSGTGEAAAPWAFTTATTDASGHGSFVADGPIVPAAGVVTATATATGRSTSEVSNCVVVGPFDGRAVDLTVDPGATSAGDVASFVDRDGDTDPSRYQATIDWGDGNSPVAGTVVARPGGRLAVVGSHAWPRELRTSTTITVREPDDAVTATFVGDVHVAPGAEAAQGRDADSNQNTGSGVVVASYQDSDDPTPWNVALDWGFAQDPWTAATQTRTATGADVATTPPQFPPGSYTLEVLLRTPGDIEYARPYVAHSTYLVKSDASPLATYVQFDALRYRATEDSGQASITLVRTGSVTSLATVHYAATLGTAAPSDAVPTSGTATFAPGQRRTTFTVAITDDAIGAETTETVDLRLTDPTGAVLGANASTSLAITEDIDDLPPLPPPAPVTTTTSTTTTTTIPKVTAPLPIASTTSNSPPAPPTTTKNGYLLVDSSGASYAFGAVDWRGNAPVGAMPAVDVELTPSRSGYWIVDAAGHVFTFGDASYLGGAPQLRRDETITSLSSTPAGDGYWLFTNLGRVIPYGRATHFGDMSATRLNGPVLDSVATPSGLGYYLVASDGGIFTFGDARFAGSMGAVKLNAPVQSLVPEPDGSGYWLVASDGGIFTFDAAFYGSMGSTALNRPVTGMVGGSRGYLMVGEDGGIFTFGDVGFYGSLGDHPPSRPIVSVSAA